jgi:hypothetical protein
MHYSYQHEGKVDQATTQLLNIRNRLSGRSGALDVKTQWVPKPPGMHLKTYEYLLA